MSTPGFSAERSLYRSKSHYRGARNSALVEGARVIDLSCGSGDAVVGPALVIARIPGEARESSIVPMSLPGNHWNPRTSTRCVSCVNDCGAAEVACIAASTGACAALWVVPFIGGGLFAGCAAAATALCTAAAESCSSNCFNIGSQCCPVACGNSCCNSSELCLDSGQGLCCTAGTLPCYGPNKSCYDPRREKCLPSGAGCPVGSECGDNCCDQYSQCIDPNLGNCCSRFSGIPCGSECCDILTQGCTAMGCCPREQACDDYCCSSGYICRNGQCIVAKTCSAAESLCVSDDGKSQNCCPRGMSCWTDGTCHPPFVG
jgi:hypothetical protein